MSIELHLSHEYGSSKRCTFNTSINGLHSLYNWAIQPKKKREDMMSNLFGDQQKEMSFIPKTYPSEDPQII